MATFLHAGKLFFLIGVVFVYALASHIVWANSDKHSIPVLTVTAPKAAVGDEDRILGLSLDPPYDAIQAMTWGRSALQRWNLGNPADAFRATDGQLFASCQWLKPEAVVVCHDLLSIIVYDGNDGHKVRTFSTESSSGWPFACSANGTCAWQVVRQDVTVIAVQNVLKPTPPEEVKVGNVQVLYLAFSDDSDTLAIATSDRRVLLHHVGTKGNCSSFNIPNGHKEQTQLGSFASGSAEYQKLKRPGPLFVFPQQGSATALSFDPNGRRLAIGSSDGVYIVDLKTCTGRALPFEHEPVSAISFGKSRLVAADAAGNLKSWESDTLKESAPLPASRIVPNGLILAPNEEILAVLGSRARAEFVDLSRSRLVGTVAFFPAEQKWLAWNDDGFFTGSDGAWKYGTWHFDQAPDKPIPMEAYYYDFFDYELIKHMLTDAVPAVSISDRNRATPHVKLEELWENPSKTMVTPDRGMVFVPETAAFRVTAVASENSKGISSLAVVHNGLVVRKLEPAGKLTQKVEMEIKIQLHPAANTVEAYAFNEDKVRSPAVTWTRPMQSFAYQAPQSTLRVLAIGVSKYRNPAFNLRYAADDASLAATSFQTDASSYAHISKVAMQRPIDLFSAKTYLIPGRIQVTQLINENATRAKILEQLHNLASEAQPDDVLIVFLAGHGVRTQSPDRYYFLPYDMSLMGKPTEQTIQTVSASASTMISDVDLTNALSALTVRHSVLIVDTCHAGELESYPFLIGPLQDRSFARLAYEKGMYVLLSTQSDSAANEPSQLKHGLLAYSLFNDGLAREQADSMPKDKLIELGEWLSYGQRRTKQLSRERRDTSLQEPVFVPNVTSAQEQVYIRAQLQP